jgi:hypothetical protein
MRTTDGGGAPPLASMLPAEEALVGAAGARDRARSKRRVLDSRLIDLAREMEGLAGGDRQTQLQQSIDELARERDYLDQCEQARQARARAQGVRRAGNVALLERLQSLRQAALREIVPATLPPATRSRLAALGLTLHDVCVFDTCTQRGTCEVAVLRNTICYHGWAVLSECCGERDPVTLWRKVVAQRPRLPPWARGRDQATASIVPSPDSATKPRWPPGRVVPLTTLVEREASEGEVRLLSELDMPDGPAGYLGAGRGFLPARAVKQGGRRRVGPSVARGSASLPITVPALRVPDPHCLFGSPDRSSRFGCAVGGRKLSQRAARGVRLMTRELASATNAKAKRLLSAVDETQPPPPAKRAKTSAS